MSIKYFLYALGLSALALSVANKTILSNSVDIEFAMLYFLFALIFAFVCGIIGKKRIDTPSGVGYVPDSFNRTAYITHVSIFVIWSLIYLLLLGTRQPPAWMTVIPVGVVFLLFYLIGYIKRKYNAYIKASFFINYAYLAVTILTVKMAAFPSSGNSMGEGYFWIFIVLPLTYLLVLVALVNIMIGLTRSS